MVMSNVLGSVLLMFVVFLKNLGIPISMYITGVVVATVVFTGAACATLFIGWRRWKETKAREARRAAAKREQKHSTADTPSDTAEELERARARERALEKEREAAAMTSSLELQQSTQSLNTLKARQNPAYWVQSRPLPAPPHDYIYEN